MFEKMRERWTKVINPLVHRMGGVDPSLLTWTSLILSIFAFYLLMTAGDDTNGAILIVGGVVVRWNSSCNRDECSIRGQRRLWISGWPPHPIRFLHGHSGSIGRSGQNLWRILKSRQDGANTGCTGSGSMAGALGCRRNRNVRSPLVRRMGAFGEQ